MRDSQPHPKPVRIKSKALTNSAKGQACTLRLTGYCNGNPETTVFAHLRGSWALGIATKPADYFGVYSCSDCHSRLDRGGAAAYDILRALYETQASMVRNGLIVIKGAYP